MRAVVYCHAYVGNGFNAGGETTLHDLNVALVRSGWTVEVVLSEPCVNGSTEAYQIDGVTVLPHEDNRQPLRVMPGADLLISHLGCALRTSLIGRRLKIPVAHIIHNELDITKGHSRLADLLVFNTDWVRKSFEASGFKTPSLVVRPAVDPDQYRTETTREYITLVNLSDGRDPNGNPGRYDKGARMMYHLAREFPGERFLGVKGSYGTQYTEDGYDNVTIMDNVSDPREFYSKTGVVISPSNYESYGRISVEAAASGIPSITSRAEGFEEHRIASLREPFDQPAAWTRALEILLGSYDYYCDYAQLRSAVIWEQTQKEVAEFVERCSSVAKRGKRRR